MIAPSWIRQASLAIGVLGRCALAYRFGIPSDANPQFLTIDGLAVSTAALRIGEVWETDDHPFRLQITNSTGHDIDVQDFQVSYTCIRVEPRHLTIPAHGSAPVDLTLDLTRRTIDELGRGERPVSSEIRPVRKRGGNPNAGWVIEGTVKSRLALGTSFLDLGGMPIHGGPPAWQKVQVSAFVPAKGLTVTAEPPLAIAKVSPGSTDSQFVLSVAASPNIPPGPFHFDLMVRPVGPDGEILPGIHLPVAGEMQHEARALPARVWLGDYPVGETAQSTIIFQSLPDSSWVVEHIESESAGISVRPSDVPGVKKGHAFVLHQRIEGPGDHESVVRFFVRKNQGGQPEGVAVRVSYHGQAHPTPTPEKPKRK